MTQLFQSAHYSRCRRINSVAWNGGLSPCRQSQDSPRQTEIYMLSTGAVSSVTKGRTGEQGVGVSSGLRVAVLLPCLNEAAAIGDVLAEFRKALPNADIYVIDNG